MAAKKEPAKKAAKKAPAKKAPAKKVTRLENKTATKEERSIAKKSDAASRKKATAERVGRVKGVGGEKISSKDAAKARRIEDAMQEKADSTASRRAKREDGRMSDTGEIPTSRFRKSGLDDDTAVNAVPSNMDRLTEQKHMANYRDAVKRGRADQAAGHKADYFAHVTAKGSHHEEMQQPCATSGCGGEAHKELDNDVCSPCGAAGRS